MKKILITKLIVLSILLIIIIPLSIGLLGGRNYFLSMNWNSDVTGSELITNSKYENITELTVGMVEEDILIREHDQDYILVNYIGNDNHKPLVDVKGGRLSIEHKKQWGLFNLKFNFNTKGRLEIYVPVDSLQEMSLNSVSGNVNVDAKSVELSAETVSGFMVVNKEGSMADLSTISGSIHVYKPFDILEFETISGSVKVDTKKGSTVSGSTISGGVTAILCDGCGYNVDFDSVSGNLKDEYNNQRYGNEISQSEGVADVHFDVETVSGNLTFKNWE